MALSVVFTSDELNLHLEGGRGGLKGRSGKGMGRRWKGREGESEAAPEGGGGGGGKG